QLDLRRACDPHRGLARPGALVGLPLDGRLEPLEPAREAVYPPSRVADERLCGRLRLDHLHPFLLRYGKPYKRCKGSLTHGGSGAQGADDLTTRQMLDSTK